MQSDVTVTHVSSVLPSLQSHMSRRPSFYQDSRDSTPDQFPTSNVLGIGLDGVVPEFINYPDVTAPSSSFDRIQPEEPNIVRVSAGPSSSFSQGLYAYAWPFGHSLCLLSFTFAHTHSPCLLFWFLNLVFSCFIQMCH